MEIKQLDKTVFVGKRFAVRYPTNGYYDICKSENGFNINYVPFDKAVERKFEDEFFSEWLENPVAYGAFDGENLLGFAEGRRKCGTIASASAIFACSIPLHVIAASAQPC